MNEFRLLSGEHEVAPVLRLVGPIERSTARGALVRRDRLAVFREGRTEDVEHAADCDFVHADVDVIADAGRLATEQRHQHARQALQSREHVGGGNA